MTVDRDAMSHAQRQAWDALWRLLLMPEGNEKTRVTDSLEARSDAGESADTEASTCRNHNAAERKVTDDQ